MHAVIGGVRGLDGEEGAGADMQRRGEPRDAGGVERRRQPLGEMQPGGRRGDGAVLRREHRLVVGVVAGIAARGPLDVGRQRHAAEAREPGAKFLPLDVEAQRHVAFRVLGGDRGGEALAEGDGIAGLHPLAALDEGAPGAAADIAVERHLDPGRAAHADQPCRDDARVVADQQVARPQQKRQVADGAVRQCRPDDEQARGVARLDRMVRDQLPRQLEIEIVDAHGAAL